ncbi:hypothetical protein EZV62_014567 [Acer yangbiense]|uniref:Poly A polymerase head domain-containing protein n=1 Tax=Acer yangbiense TaxID=1000413 RepID=A0A5C7HT78_9ROSI|nr:hypothetical protein EZV62_014567 [Acer yangbiense]
MKRHTGTITNRKVGLSSVMEFETDRTLLESVVMPVVFHLQGSYEVQGMVYTTVFKKFDNQQLKKMQLEIDTSMINQPMREFLGVLNKEGFEAYLVGGCVRDLMLKKIPTSYEVITSAKLEEVQSLFFRSTIVDEEQFRVCRLSVDDSVVEVLSLSSFVNKSSGDFEVYFRKPSTCSDRDYIYWKVCLQQDFTVNGLYIVYDFVGGIYDIMKRQVRTIIPGKIYFDMDPVQILRAVGVAAQLKFELESDTSLSLKELSHHVQDIDTEIILNEVHRMLAFGHAKDSLMLLWRIGLLEILIPGQGFASQNIEESNMLPQLFSKLDDIVEPEENRPSSKELWVCIIYFYLALVRKPRDPRVCAVFTLAIRNGYFLEAAKRVIHIPHQSYDTILCELSTSQDLGEEEIKEQILDLLTSIVNVISTTRHGVFPFKMIMGKVGEIFAGFKWEFEHEREIDESRWDLMVERDEMEDGDEVCWSDDYFWDMIYRKDGEELGHRLLLKCGQSAVVLAMIVYSTVFSCVCVVESTSSCLNAFLC